MRLPVPDPPLRDGAVALRLLGPADAEAIAAALQDPEIPRWTTVPRPYTRADADDWLAGVEPRRAAGDAIAFAIVDADGGGLLGSIDLRVVDEGHRIADVGYWLAAGARGRGVCTSALRLLAAYAFLTVGVQRLEVKAAVENLASQRVAELAGCTREGVLRSYHDRKGAREDLVLFSLLPTDPAAAQ